MKKLVIVAALLLSNLICNAASNLKVMIDPRVELTSIVFRLAGAEEYVTDRATNYLTTVDDYFTEYTNHPLIRYIKEIREQYRLYYGKVAGMSFLFNIQNSHIVPISNNAVKLWITEYWNTESADKYYQLLDDFYSDSNFELFWEKQQDLYSTSLRKSKQIVDSMRIDIEWFESFYGEKLNDIEINIALLNGPHNYALDSILENDNSCSVLVGCYSEENGIPVLPDDFNDVLIHEICHTIGNPIIYRYIDNIKGFDAVYSHINQMTKEHGYGDFDPNCAIVESFTDLACSEYLSFSQWPFAGYQIADAEDKGFLWMSDLVHFMENFNLNRDTYPSIKEFMPQIVAYYNELPDRIDDIILNYTAEKPYIESTYPAKGSTVSADIKEIRIMLSHPVIDAYGQLPIDGIKSIPLGYSYRSDDHRTVIVPISMPLEHGKTYGIELEGCMFISEKSFHRMSKNYKLIFSTE